MTVQIWKAMGISKFEMKPTEKGGFIAETGDGSSGTLKILHRGQYHNVVLGEGVYKNAFLPKAIRAKILIHMQTQFSKDKAGQNISPQIAFFCMWLFPILGCGNRLENPRTAEQSRGRPEFSRRFVIRFSDVAIHDQTTGVDRIPLEKNGRCSREKERAISKSRSPGLRCGEQEIDPTSHSEKHCKNLLESCADRLDRNFRINVFRFVLMSLTMTKQR